MIDINVFIEARKIAGHSRNKAAAEIGCGLSTIYSMEHDQRQPGHPFMIREIEKYIQKHTPKTKEIKE